MSSLVPYGENVADVVKRMHPGMHVNKHSRLCLNHGGKFEVVVYYSLDTLKWHALGLKRGSIQQVPVGSDPCLVLLLQDLHVNPMYHNMTRPRYMVKSHRAERKQKKNV